jgi:hypothetical protein
MQPDAFLHGALTKLAIICAEPSRLLFGSITYPFVSRAVPPKHRTQAHPVHESGVRFRDPALPTPPETAFAPLPIGVGTPPIIFELMLVTQAFGPLAVHREDRPAEILERS